MHVGENNQQLTWFVRLATVVLVVAILQFAQDVLLPIAFAGLLAFLLSPLVVRLTRMHVPKTAAIIITVCIAFAALGIVGWIVSTQALNLIRELPKYEQNLHLKISRLKQNQHPGVASRVVEMIENLRRDLEAPRPAKAGPPPARDDEPKPVPVEVRSTEPSPWQLARGILGPVLRPLGIAGIIIVFVIAMLFQREDLRDRVLKLVSAGQINMGTQALDDAATRVSRYLGMQLVVNATYGIPVGVGLFFIGIPNALLWGLLATLLRFIPFVGPWIAATFPVCLAVAVDPGWSKLLYVIGLFLVMELISNNIVEVVVYGASTGISNFALLVAAVFWTWLWGPAGLALSTPLTVCLLVLGNYVPGLAFLKMMLGSEPVLEPPDQFYQRMLSMESEDMLDLAIRHIDEHSLEVFYDDVFLPALLMSEEDRHRGALPESRQRFIFQASRDLIDELERDEEESAHEAAMTSATPEELSTKPLLQPTPPRILILPARDEADELVALMLCHMFRRRGVAASVQTLTAPFDGTIKVLEQHAVDLVIISALPPSSTGAVRQLCRKLRVRKPDLPLIIGVWRHRGTLPELHGRLRLPKPEQIVDSLAAALAAAERTLPPGVFKPAVPKPDKHRLTSDTHTPLSGSAPLKA